MIKHKVTYGEYDIETLDPTLLAPPVEKWPISRPPKGKKIACPICGAEGWPPDTRWAIPSYHWTLAHVHPHTRCGCGKIVVHGETAYRNHCRSVQHKEWEACQQSSDTNMPATAAE